MLKGYYLLTSCIVNAHVYAERIGDLPAVKECGDISEVDKDIGGEKDCKTGKKRKVGHTEREWTSPQQTERIFCRNPSDAYDKRRERHAENHRRGTRPAETEIFIFRKRRHSKNENDVYRENHGNERK